MGTLLSILGSLGIISSGAGSTATAIGAAPIAVESLPTQTPSIISKILLNSLKDCFNRNLSGAEEIIQSLARYLKVTIPENLSSAEIIEYFETAALSSSTESAVEGGILAGSLGTAAETLGVSLAIGAAVYGGYYAYEHWDSIKHFASETLKTTEHYISYATNYLKSWWPF